MFASVPWTDLAVAVGVAIVVAVAVVESVDENVEAVLSLVAVAFAVVGGGDVVASIRWRRMPTIRLLVVVQDWQGCAWCSGHRKTRMPSL